MGDIGYGIDPNALKYLADQLYQVKSNFELKISIVVGGGNIWRGADYEQQGMDRSVADSAGMVGTMINALALQDSLERKNVPVRTLSALSTPSVAEPFIRRKATRHLSKGRIVNFGGGTGNPYFTTDTAATLRAIEIEADIILKGTRVDGIFTADPEKDSTANMYETITFDELFQKELSVMDLTACTLCKENKLPIKVFNMNTEGNLQKICDGENVGTLVKF